MCHFSETRTITGVAPPLLCSSQTHPAPPPRHGWCVMRRAKYLPQCAPQVGLRGSRSLTWYKTRACECTPTYQIAPTRKWAHHEWHLRYAWRFTTYQTQMAQREQSPLAYPPQTRQRARSETALCVICDLDQCTAIDSRLIAPQMLMRQTSSHSHSHVNFVSFAFHPYYS